MVLPGDVSRIDKALAVWRQGDCALEENWFTHIAYLPNDSMLKSGQAEKELGSITKEVEGLTVVTQSCDIVRSCNQRPFLEVASLVKVDRPFINEVKRGRRPAYAFVPATEAMGLVADLDRIMTVEKAVVSDWKRTQGCTTDTEIRAFAQALARKRARFAFPDDFTRFASAISNRLQEKHDKHTEQGIALRALREIRVRAEPSWDDLDIELFFWFIRDRTDLGNMSWDSLLESWLKLMPAKGRFTCVDGVVVLLEDITARDYVESIPLDLDHLSGNDNLRT